MHPFLSQLYAQARAAKATIILAEAEDPRVLKAAGIIRKRGIANLILVGNPERIRRLAKRINTPVIDQNAYDFGLAERLYKLRKLKLKEAKALVKDPRYFAAMVVQTGEADGFVSGNLSTTAETLRPALQILKTKGNKRAFSYFIMLDPKQKEPRFFADCGLTFDPNKKELAAIALGTAEIARSFGIEPRVAMLGYSTHGSAGGMIAERVRDAIRIVKRKAPRLAIDELQFDAAFVPEVGKQKAPKSKVAGRANVFIFPDLASGNIGYKIAQRLGRWQAIGPIMAGLKRPANDLSRGCSVEEIVAAVAITAVQSREK